jgi:titin
MKVRLLYNFYILAIIFLSITFLQSCADLSTSPEGTDNSGNLNSKVKITSPANNSQISEGLQEIIYSIDLPYSLRFVELYINGDFKRNYPPNKDGSAPQINYNFDSTYVGQIISLYLIYYDNNNTFEKSNVVNNISVVKDNKPPSKPYDLQLINFKNGSVNLSWKDSSRLVDKYQIWRKVGTNGTYSILQEVSGNTNNINDSGLDTSLVYFYKLKAINTFGESPFSDEINSKGIINSSSLAPASNLTATLLSSNNVQLQWIDNSNNENYFVVERSTDNIKFMAIANLPQNTVEYEDLTAGQFIGVTLHYRIKSYSNTDSAFSNIASINLISGTLLAPTNLSATYNKSVGVIELRWNKTDLKTLYFDVERKTNATGYQLIRRIDASNNIYLDFNITVNTNYTYRVRGYDLVHYSDYSNEVTISTN